MMTRLLPSKYRKRLKHLIVDRFGWIEMSSAYEIREDELYKSLAGKSAVVTGASGTIGRSIVIMLALRGARVIAVGRDRTKLELLAKEVRLLGGEIVLEQADLISIPEIEELATRTGHVDVLVNNAGHSSRDASQMIWNQDPTVIDELIALNLRAAIALTSEFGKEMVRAKCGGSIVNISSSVGYGGLAGYSEYAASKAGLEGFTRSVALELGPHNVTVNCVAPGFIPRGQVSKSNVDNLLAKSVVPRLGRVEDVSEMVAYLAGPKGSWITGQTIRVDGGRTLGLYGGN